MSGSESRYFISRLPDSPVSVRARFGERKYRSLQARMIFFQPTPQGPDLAEYSGHGTTFAGWEIKYAVIFGMPFGSGPDSVMRCTGVDGHVPDDFFPACFTFEV